MTEGLSKSLTWALAIVGGIAAIATIYQVFFQPPPQVIVAVPSPQSTSPPTNKPQDVADGVTVIATFMHLDRKFASANLTLSFDGDALPGSTVEDIVIGAWFVDKGTDLGFLSKSIPFSNQNTIVTVDLTRIVKVSDELYVCWTAKFGAERTGRLELRDLKDLKVQKDNWVSSDAPLKKRPITLTGKEIDCSSRASLKSAQLLVAQN